MARWILLRHASAEHGGRDEDRPLSAEGEREAAAVGAWLAAHGWLPDRVVCSPARRTRQTYALASAMWPSPPEAIMMAALYAASAAEYPHWLAEEGTTMIVGHNPAMDEFVRSRSAQAPPMRPGTAACFEDGTWVASG